MVALYVIAGIVIFFWLVLSLNASVRVIINSKDKESTNIYAKIGFYKIYIVPPKPVKAKKVKKEKPVKVKKEKQQKKEKSKKKEEEKPAKEKKKLNIPAILQLVKNIAEILWKKLRKFLKFKIYKITINAASDDAYKTSQLYAALIQASYYLYEFMDNNFKISLKSNESIKIAPDFSGEKLSFDIDVKIYIKLSHILNIGISSAVCFLKFLMKSSSDSKSEADKSDKIDGTEKADKNKNTNEKTEKINNPDAAEKSAAAG